jgi:hypothetical protein
VTWEQWTSIQKGERHRILKHDPTLYLATDDPTENACHNLIHLCPFAKGFIFAHSQKGNRRAGGEIPAFLSFTTKLSPIR